MEDIFLMNPRRRKRSQKRRHHKRGRRRNPGESLAILNPRRKRRHYRSHGRHRRHYRRNPGFSIGSLDLMTIGAGVAGAVGSRFISNQILEKVVKQPDTGIIGAAATFATGLAVSFIVRKFGKQPKLANGIALGAGIMAATRVVDDLLIQKKSLGEFLGMGEYMPDFSAGGDSRMSGILGFPSAGETERYLDRY